MSRAENSAQFIDDEVLINELDYLPALNITYRPTEKINLRSAISITLARPEFRELSNFSFQDYIGGRTVYGNPDLLNEPGYIIMTLDLNYFLKQANY